MNMTKKTTLSKETIHMKCQNLFCEKKRRKLSSMIYLLNFHDSAEV